MQASNRYSFNNEPEWQKLLLFLVWFFCIIAMCFLLSGCKTIEYVPKVETKIEYRDRVERDTTFVRDSVYIRQKNDTIYVDKYKYIYREHIKTDTSFVYQSDTITIVQEVEKKLSRWQQAKMSLGGYSFALLVLLVLGGLGYLAYKIWFRK